MSTISVNPFHAASISAVSPVNCYIIMIIYLHKSSYIYFITIIKLCLNSFTIIKKQTFLHYLFSMVFNIYCRWNSVFESEFFTYFRYFSDQYSSNVFISLEVTKYIVIDAMNAYFEIISIERVSVMQSQGILLGNVFGWVRRKSES